jgi:hypothetical protein
VSTDDQLKLLIRRELDAALPDLAPAPDLARGVRRRYRRRKLKRARLAGLVVVVLAVGAGSASALTRALREGGRSTVDLAGYTVTLPLGVHASPLQFLPSRPTPQPPLSSALAECKAGAGVGFLMNSPAAWGSPPYQQPALSNFVVTSPSSSGCVSGLMTLPYGSGTAPTPDLVAPSGSTSVDIGPYPTEQFDTGGSYVAATYFEFAYYVQLPTSGGGFQDLIVASLGIPRPEVVELIQQVVVQYENSAPASG